MDTKQRFISIHGENIAVSEEVYLAYKRPIWAEQKRRDREGRCQDIKGVRCAEDCKLCDKQRMGKPMSLDKLIEDGLEYADPNDIDETVTNDELRRALRKAVAELPEDEKRIINIAFQGKPERETAVKIGLSRNTFTYKRDRIVDKLKNTLIIFR
jgi:RNA polymerase sigma factor (sigma-70 family)